MSHLAKEEREARLAHDSGDSGKAKPSRTSSGKAAVNMFTDLSTHHQPVSNFLNRSAAIESGSFRLSNDQLEFFHVYCYLAGIRWLNDQQIDTLRAELTELIDPR